MLMQYNTTVSPSVNTIAPGMFCGARYSHHNTIQYNFIVKCQYNCTRNVLWYQVLSSQHSTIQFNTTSLSSVNTIALRMFCGTKYSHHNTIQLYCQVSIQLPQECFVVPSTLITILYNTTVLPSVNTIALGMFCGTKYSHHNTIPVSYTHLTLPTRSTV